MIASVRIYLFKHGRVNNYVSLFNSYDKKVKSMDDNHMCVYRKIK